MASVKKQNTDTKYSVQLWKMENLKPSRSSSTPPNTAEKLILRFNVRHTKECSYGEIAAPRFFGRSFVRDPFFAEEKILKSNKGENVSVSCEFSPSAHNNRNIEKPKQKLQQFWNWLATDSMDGVCSVAADTAGDTNVGRPTYWWRRRRNSRSRVEKSFQRTAKNRLKSLQRSITQSYDFLKSVFSFSWWAAYLAQLDWIFL